MKFTTMALATAFALSGTCAFAHTVRHRSNVTAHPMELSLNFGDGLAGQAAAVMG
jgi:hypothetical protein